MSSCRKRALCCEIHDLKSITRSGRSLSLALVFARGDGHIGHASNEGTMRTPSVIKSHWTDQRESIRDRQTGRSWSISREETVQRCSHGMLDYGLSSFSLIPCETELSLFCCFLSSCISFSFLCWSSPSPFQIVLCVFCPTIKLTLYH